MNKDEIFNTLKEMYLIKNNLLKIISFVIIFNLFVNAYAEVDFACEICLEIQNDRIYKSDDEYKEINDLYAVIEPLFTLKITDSLSVDAVFVIEPILDPKPGKNRIFEDEGCFVEEIKINYEINNLFFYVGKYNPSFGLAWDLTPGIYGTDIVEDYELTGMIGIGIKIHLDAKKKQSISLNSFFADTSLLSKSTHGSSERLDVNDGKAGNTEDLNSYTLSYDSELFSNLKYQIAYRFLKEGVDSLADEKGYSIGAEYTFNMSNGNKIIPLLEYALIENYEGYDLDFLYSTFGCSLIIKSWNFVTSYTEKCIVSDYASDLKDYQFQVSSGYSFKNGLNINIGFKKIKEDYIRTKAVGLLVSYSLNF